MNIELKNIKYAEFASEETSCFEASLYIDGKRVAIVNNEGRGGPTMYNPIPKSGMKRSELEAILGPVEDELNKETLDTRYGPMENCLDFVVEDLLSEHLFKKEMKPKLRKRVMYTDPSCEAGQYKMLPSKHKPSPAMFEALKKTNWWSSEHVLLNELSIEEISKVLD